MFEKMFIKNIKMYRESTLNCHRLDIYIVNVTGANNQK